MALLTMLMMAAGVMMATVGGLVSQSGTNALYGSLDWLPQSELLFCHPGAACVVGIVLAVLGLVCQPRRLS